jgi:hypothetical protein
MAEFQKKKAHEDLLSALGKMGLQVSPELKPGEAGAAHLGPGETVPITFPASVDPKSNYLPPAPAAAVPAESLEPPAED